MSFSKILEKLDRVLTGRLCVFDMGSPFLKTVCYFRFFKYFWKSATSYPVINGKYCSTQILPNKLKKMFSPKIVEPFYPQVFFNEFQLSVASLRNI